MSVLRLITTDSSSDILWINQEEDRDPVLMYKGVSLDKGGSPRSRLLTCSSLSKILSEYFIKGTKFIINTYNPVLCYLFPGDSHYDQQFTPATKFIPQLSTPGLARNEVDGFNSALPGVTQDSVKSIKACDSWYNSPVESKAVEEKIDETIEKVFGNSLRFDELDYEKEVRDKLGEYSSDIVDEVLTVSLVPDTLYTDTINLEDWVYKSGKPGVSAKLDISFYYSMDGKIYGGSQTIKPFEYLESGDLKPCNYLVKVGKVQLEYIRFVIKIYPLEDGIDEIVINDCTMTIGNL